MGLRWAVGLALECVLICAEAVCGMRRMPTYQAVFREMAWEGGSTKQLGISRLDSVWTERLS